MSDTPFRELRGDYVENIGQSINLGEYLDYFEPLGSALSRLPDGRGGPFIHQFSDGGGRTISSIGWVVSAASKRFGGWKLWGMWSDRPIPPITLPLFWSRLDDTDLIARANEDAPRLFDRDALPELFDELQTIRLHDADFRDALKSQLSRAYASRPPHERPIEVEVTDQTLDLLPWLYLLGPVDPAAAQLKPSRFNGAGYQYFLTDALPRAASDVLPEVDEIVDTAATDAFAGWQMAEELRARRRRPPRPAARTAARPTTRTTTRPGPEPPENPSMRKQPTRSSPPPASAAPFPFTLIYQALVIALLAFIAWNVNEIRRGQKPRIEPAATVVTETQEPAPEAAPPTVDPEPDLRAIARSLAANLPQGIRIEPRALTAPTQESLSRVAVEIFLRRNACFARTEAVDGRFSTAEQRAIRTCTSLQTAGLMSSGVEPNEERAIDWIERLTIAANR